MYVDAPRDDISYLWGGFLLNYDFIYQSVYSVLDIKLTLSGVLVIFRLTEVSLKKFYFLEIHVHAEIHFKYNYQ